MREINVQRSLAVAVPLSFVLIVVLWMALAWTVQVPKENAELFSVLNTLIGVIGAWSAMIIGYYFNSSSSSARKDEIIAASAPARGDAAAADGDIIKPRTP